MVAPLIIGLGILLGSLGIGAGAVITHRVLSNHDRKLLEKIDEKLEKARKEAELAEKRMQTQMSQMERKLETLRMQLEYVRLQRELQDELERIDDVGVRREVLNGMLTIGPA